MVEKEIELVQFLIIFFTIILYNFFLLLTQGEKGHKGDNGPMGLPVSIFINIFPK